MAPTPSKPVPLSYDEPPMDMRWMCRNSDRWPTDLTCPKHAVNERMWCELCECDPCQNIEYEETVMNSAGYISFLGRVSKKYNDNLISEVPSDNDQLTPLCYVKKIFFWNYEHYAKLIGYAWGRGEYSEIPE